MTDDKMTGGGAEDAVVVLREIAVAGGRALGHAELNVESTLNSLSLDMIRLLTPALEDWRMRDEVVGVLITARGEKAFCAGGDIQALYHSIGENHAAGKIVNDYPYRFFAEEYRLDYALHTFPKPVLTIGHGIVMGGGLGIFGASRFRVLTEKSRLAVPEITIGLFPDAGGTWTLGRMQTHHASFLGLTGSQVNATDAQLCGMGTHLVAHNERHDLFHSLLGLNWGDDVKANIAMVEDLLDRLPVPDSPPGELALVEEREVFTDDFQREIATTRQLAGRSAWIDRGLSNLKNGCPTTAGIVLEQLRRVPQMSLAETFRMEFTVASHCADNKDFHEGVRALLIDKDNAPRWHDADLEQIDWGHVMSHFIEASTPHPLTDLGD